jgi:dihydrodipicolinate synthase/N-acetylneuraminate lyase
MNNRFSGVHWMLATPFDEQEWVDVESISRLVLKARQSGCQGVVALGVTGEAARLTDLERHLVAKTVMDNANGMPVTVGTTAASTSAAIDYSLEAQKLGAASVMVSNGLRTPSGQTQL